VSFKIVAEIIDPGTGKR